MRSEEEIRERMRKLEDKLGESEMKGWTDHKGGKRHYVKALKWVLGEE